MKTTFLLHGGRLKLDDSRNDEYFRELTAGLDDGDELLFIGFARVDEVDRRQQYEKEVGWIKAQTSRDIDVVYASEQDFMAQIARVKAIQITGGESDKLVAKIQEYPEFIKAIAGKKIGGSSAGACLFSANYYYFPDDAVHQGLGIIPVNLNVHHNNPAYGDSDQAITKLRAVDNSLDLLCLDECDWRKYTLDL